MNGKILLTLLACLVAAMAFSFGPEKHNDRIVGGVVATRPGFEHLVFIYFGATMCTGTLLNEEWVLTAGHCTHPFRDHNKTGQVILGSYDRFAHNDTSTEDGLKVHFSEAITHPNYGRLVIKHDVGLIRLDNKVSNTTKGVQYVKYLAKELIAYQAGFPVTAAGWGTTDEHPNIAAPQLHEVNVTIDSHADCVAEYGALVVGLDYCLNTTGGMGVCHGDSGGPTMTRDLQVQIGVTSYGENPCNNSAPHAVANVAEHREWIETVTGINLPDPPPISHDGEVLDEIDESRKPIRLY